MQSVPFSCICNNNPMLETITNFSKIEFDFQQFQQISIKISLFFQLNFLQIILCGTSVLGKVHYEGYIQPH
jgi:hypothetical protein